MSKGTSLCLAASKNELKEELAYETGHKKIVELLRKSCSYQKEDK